MPQAVLVAILAVAVLALAGWIGNILNSAVHLAMSSWFRWPLSLSSMVTLTPDSACVVAVLVFGATIGAAIYGARSLAALGLTGAAWAWASAFLVAAFLPIVAL